MLGFDGHIRKEDCDAMVKARLIFNEGQQNWFNKNKEKGVKLKEEQLSNMRNGGECNVFDIIDIVLKALDREMLEELVPRIKPSLYVKGQSKEQKAKFYLDFLLMKICARLAKQGRDIRTLFDTLDKDKNGCIELKELVSGLSSQLGLYFHDEEIQGMYRYLDVDKSNGIDF